MARFKWGIGSCCGCDDNQYPCVFEKKISLDDFIQKYPSQPYGDLVIYVWNPEDRSFTDSYGVSYNNTFSDNITLPEESTVYPGDIYNNEYGGETYASYRPFEQMGLSHEDFYILISTLDNDESYREKVNAFRRRVGNRFVSVLRYAEGLHPYLGTESNRQGMLRRYEKTNTTSQITYNVPFDVTMSSTEKNILLTPTKVSASYSNKTYVSYYTSDTITVNINVGSPSRTSGRFSLPKGFLTCPFPYFPLSARASSMLNKKLVSTVDVDVDVETNLATSGYAYVYGGYVYRIPQGEYKALIKAKGSITLDARVYINVYHKISSAKFNLSSGYCNFDYSLGESVGQSCRVLFTLSPVATQVSFDCTVPVLYGNNNGEHEMEISLPLSAYGNSIYGADARKVFKTGRSLIDAYTSEIGGTWNENTTSKGHNFIYLTLLALGSNAFSELFPSVLNCGDAATVYCNFINLIGLDRRIWYRPSGPRELYECRE